MSQNTAVKERKAKPVARKDMTRAQWTWKEMKKNKAGYNRQMKTGNTNYMRDTGSSH